MSLSKSMTDSHDVLLIANRTCPCPDVLDMVRDRAGEGGRVNVVAPALNGRLRHYVSDVDDAVQAATERLARALHHLQAEGVEATGEIGDSDPLIAAEDALRTFPAERVVVSTYPPAHSNWMEHDLLGRLEERLGCSVTHLVSRYGLAA